MDIGLIIVAILILSTMLVVFGSAISDFIGFLFKICFYVGGILTIFGMSVWLVFAILYMDSDPDIFKGWLIAMVFVGPLSGLIFSFGWD